MGVGGAAAGVNELTELVALLAERRLELPIDSTHPLNQVRDAYARSISGHATGKIVVTPGWD